MSKLLNFEFDKFICFFVTYEKGKEKRIWNKFIIKDVENKDTLKSQVF